MEKTASTLSEKSRRAICDELNLVLSDGIDLYTQIKVAHWNLKGPLFAVLHPLFDEFASSVNDHNDKIAERAMILGGNALGTARHVAKTSRLPEYAQNTTKDLEHVKLLAERFTKYAKNLGITLECAEKNKDAVTVDMMVEIIEDVEKKAWFLFSTLSK